MSTERVALTIADGVAEIRLTGADRHNAIDQLFIDELLAAVDGATEPRGARAILLCADGPSFTVGGDLDHFYANADRLSHELRHMIKPFHQALADLAEADVPVVCAAQGPAAGGGLGMLWGSDVVIAAEDLKIATGFARIALSGDGGSSWHLQRLVGERRARELILEGRVLNAAEALEWGLVTRVVPLDSLEAEGRAAAERFAAGPTTAFREMKGLLRASGQRSLREGLAAELEAMAATGDTEDAREGIAAFTAKRRPEFGGS
jgi:2-(1,2-epoxy-1,2-dihydrophenyl)acetyl-CoA isomerase